MQPYKVLIVDDIDNNRFTLDIMLSVLGDFDIDEAESGPQALQMLRKSTYDLVLLDIMMPGMTGIEVLEQLDIMSSESTTKFIVVSALQDMETIVKALELGAADEGEPGWRAPDVFYGAYFRDLDGNKLCVCKMNMGG